MDRSGWIPSLAHRANRLAGADAIRLLHSALEPCLTPVSRAVTRNLHPPPSEPHTLRESREVPENTVEQNDHIPFTLIVPTLNAGPLFQSWLDALAIQDCKPIDTLVIDSQSGDDTVSKARAAGLRVLEIPRETFNHGGTRRLGAAEVLPADVIVFMTHDAILASPDALRRLVAEFRDPKVGAACGRQLPRPGAGVLESFARIHNYSAQSRIRDLADAAQLGVKTAFVSNSFAAYRRTALESVGGFPLDTILCEDMFVAARMLQQGWKVAYCADAQVFHSHAYGIWEEFRRYFDIGVFHARSSWVLEEFGKVGGEGLRFAIAEAGYLWQVAPFHIPLALVRNALKYLGYRLGRWERWIPVSIKRNLSLNRGYWGKNPSNKSFRA